MAPQDIFRHIKQKPFRPFRMFISDGSSFDVPDEYLARVEVTQVWIGVDPDDSGLPQRSVYLAPNHVTQIEPLPAGPASPATNGGTGGRS